jgi:hypothetical protein
MSDGLLHLTRVILMRAEVEGMAEMVPGRLWGIPSTRAECCILSTSSMISPPPQYRL